MIVVCDRQSLMDVVKSSSNPTFLKLLEKNGGPKGICIYKKKTYYFRHGENEHTEFKMKPDTLLVTYHSI